MNSFNKAGEILKNSSASNVLEKNLINASNVNSKYALDKTKFKPNTEETMLAEEIAEYFEDLDNYAAYLNIVNILGPSRTRQFWKGVQTDIEEKTGTKYEVRSQKKYFMWKFKFKHKGKVLTNNK